MLPRKNRLSKKDFRSVFSSGAFFAGKEILLKVKENGRFFSRFGFSIGIKFIPLASKRNRLKRRLIQVILKNLPLFIPGKDMIVFFKKSTKCPELESDFQKLGEELEELLKKIKLLVKK